MPKMPNTPPSQSRPEPTGAPAVEQSSTAGAGENATPQEQADYEKFVLAGLKVIYDQSTHAGIVNMLRSGDPAEALANTASMIVVQLDKKSGGKVPEEVILPGAAEILSELAQLAQRAGIFQADERVLGNAMQRMVMSLAEEYGASPDEVQQIMQSIPKDQMQQMVSQQQQLAGGTPAAQPTQPTGA